MATDSRVEAVRTGDLNTPVTLLACTQCGVLLWDINAHYDHAHPYDWRNDLTAHAGTQS